MFDENVSFIAAFGFGLGSFFSGCILPLIPAYFTFITGMSLDELTAEDISGIRKKVIISTLAYVSGFSLIFISLGAAASSIGTIAWQYSDYIRIAGGIIILIFGIHLTGIINIPALQFEKRFHFRDKPLHIFGTFVVGMAFAAGWSPCIGPYLGSILSIAAQKASVSHGIALLSAYSAGMALPFIVMSIFINYMLIFIRKATQYIIYINISSGVLLIIIGIILLMDKMSFFTLPV